MSNPITNRIRSGSEYLALHRDGSVSRPKIGLQPSGAWRVTGAVTLNNFGHVTRRYSLADVQHLGAAIPWRHKNGKQRTFLTDLDHGSRRMWCSPDHEVFSAA